VEAGAIPEDIDALRRIEAAQESDVVEQALTAARQRLGMDAAYVTTMDDRAQTIDAVVGKAEFEALTGAVVPLEQTYCARMLKGEIANVVPDTRAEPALREVSANQYIGAYVGVPVRLSDGRLHGTLCCVSSEPYDALGDEELRFMDVLARIVASRVEQAQGNLARLTQRLKGRQPTG
jgi:GAF domain-containing protein